MMDGIVMLKLHQHNVLSIMRIHYHHRNFSIPIGKDMRAMFINVGIPQHNFG